MPSSGYSAISFTAGEQPTTAKWNLVGSNDASFNNGNGFNDGIIVARHLAAASVGAASLKYGRVRARQGGTTGDANWITPGTSNTDVSAKDAFFQCGAGVCNNAGVTVTFPVAYLYPPVVVVSTITANTQNSWARVGSIGTSSFTVELFTSTTVAVTSENFSWFALGQ